MKKLAGTNVIEHDGNRIILNNDGTAEITNIASGEKQTVIPTVVMISNPNEPSVFKTAAKEVSEAITSTSKAAIVSASHGFRAAGGMFGAFNDWRKRGTTEYNHNAAVKLQKAAEEANKKAFKVQDKL